MYELINFSYKYPGSDKSVLENISLSINKGDFVIVTGHSGCGKSTLLKSLAGITHKFYGGSMSGKIKLNGTDLSQLKRRQIQRKIGILFQNPARQVVADKVSDEIFFGPSNAGIPLDNINRNVDHMAAFFDIKTLLNRDCHELSGGELQRVIIASILTMRCEILLLDEPSAQLDTSSKQALCNILEKLNKELGMTIIIAEHRISDFLKFSNKIIKFKKDGVSVVCKKDLMDEVFDENPMKISDLSDRTDDFNVKTDKSHQPILSISNLSFAYGKTRQVISNLNLKLYAGEVLSVIGENGAGKSTLLKLMCNFLKPFSGIIRYCSKDREFNPPLPEKSSRSDWFRRGFRSDKVKMMNTRSFNYAYVPQNVDYFFMQTSVKKEIILTLNQLESKKADELLGIFGLKDFLNHDPKLLSQGQKQKLALLLCLLQKPDIIFLDEPTKGIDKASKARMVDILINYKSEMKTSFVIVTQDLKFAERLSDKVIVLDRKKNQINQVPLHE